MSRKRLFLPNLLLKFTVPAFKKTKNLMSPPCPFSIGPKQSHFGHCACSGQKQIHTDDTYAYVDLSIHQKLYNNGVYCSISNFKFAQLTIKYKTPCNYMLGILSLFCSGNDTDA